MPSRKQRRRRQKELRHEYEYVYVDDEGREVEAAPPPPARTDSKRSRDDMSKKRPAARGRAPQKVDPPSWNRVTRRGAMFLPLFFVALWLLSKGRNPSQVFLLALLYTLLFIPFMYLMDRVKYRSYLRRGGTSSARENGRRR